MDDLTTITKKEANKLLLKDIKKELIMGGIYQGASLTGLGIIYEFQKSPAWQSFGVVVLLSGLYLTSQGMKDAYDKVKEYVKDSDKYVKTYHSKIII